MRTGTPPLATEIWVFPIGEEPYLSNGNNWGPKCPPWLPCDLRGWIAIADGMPPNDDEVQYSEGEDQGYGSYCDCGSWIIQRDERDDFDHNPTHWQPAPWQPVILDSADSEEG